MSDDKYLNVAGISGDWPYRSRHVCLGGSGLLVWVGEEDHLRIMTMQSGGDLNDLFGRLHCGLKILQGLLPDFAMSDKYGAIASCPTNLGAGMRASLHMKTPTSNQRCELICRRSRPRPRKLGLAVRGAGGEHSDAEADGLVDISPSARLGVSEMQIMRRLYDGVAALWAAETATASLIRVSGLIYEIKNGLTLGRLKHRGPFN